MRKIAAFSTRQSEVFGLSTLQGRTLKLTGDHPVYLPDTNEFVRADHLEELYGETKNTDRPKLLVMLNSVSAGQVQPQQVSQTELQGVLLFDCVQQTPSCFEAQKTLRPMQNSGNYLRRAQQKCKILLEGMFGGVKTTCAPQSMPALWRCIYAARSAYNVLLQGLRQLLPRKTNDRQREFALQGRKKLFEVVRRNEAPYTGTRQMLRDLHQPKEAAHAPREPQPTGQQRAQLDNAVCDTSHSPPQISYDTLAMVRRVGGDPVTVYDLEVEETHNFFAEGICVHNCLIIDDSLKNAEESDSATTREALWNWYSSTAYTRLAPGGGVLVIQTCWHDADLAGKLQQEMASASPDDPDVDRFEVIKYPAIAEHDEYLDYDTDLIMYDEMPENGRLLRNKGEALHPERFDLTKLNRIKRTLPTRFWAALYQQNPVPDDGAYFTKDQFKRGVLPDRKHSNVMIAWDFAISEKAHNDYTVGTVGLQDTDDMLHVAEVVRFKSADAFFIVESILNLAKRWYHPSLILGFEDGQIYRSIEALLKKRMRETKFYPSIVVLRPITDKLARGRALQGRMQQGMVSFNIDADWYDTVRNEMLRFPAGVHDDCVDSAAWMAQMAVGREPPKLPKTKAAKSWKDKLRGGFGETTHMSA